MHAPVHHVDRQLEAEHQLERAQLLDELLAAEARLGRHEEQLRLPLRAVSPAAARGELERAAAQTIERDA